MKIKTSVTLTDTLVAEMDEVCGGARSRSAFIEDAVRAYLNDLVRQQREAADLAILNDNAERLNSEALDVLEYQALL